MQEAAFLSNKESLCPSSPRSTFGSPTAQVNAHLALPLPPCCHPDLTRTPSGSFHSLPFSLRRDLSRPLCFLPWNPPERGGSQASHLGSPVGSLGTPQDHLPHLTGTQLSPDGSHLYSGFTLISPIITLCWSTPISTSTSTPTRAPFTLTQAVPRMKNGSRPEGTPGGQASWGHNQSPRLGQHTTPGSDPQGAQPPFQRRIVTSRSQFFP